MKWIIFSIILWAISGVFMLTKFRQLKKHILPTKSNTLLRDILNLSFNREDVEDAAQCIIEGLRNFYKIDYCSIFKADNNILKLLASNADPVFHTNITKNVNNSLSKIEEYNAKITVSENYLPYDSATTRKIKYSYFIPLNINNILIGALFIENTNENDLNVEKEFFSIIIENITIVLQNLLYYETISNLAMLDGLTGIYNRNYMNIFLANALQKKNSFSLAIFDIDFFKKFNDSYGHLFGDLTLKIVSGFVKSQLNGNDIIFRFGGEEFILYLENKTEDQAFSIVEAIRIGIEQLSIEDDRNKTNVKCSFGCYEVSSLDSVITDIIKCADVALYHSKDNGRNRTTKYTEL